MSESHENRYRIADIAKETGVSTTTVYKHLKRLKSQMKEYLIKEAGITYLAKPGAEILKNVILTPAENPRLIQSTSNLLSKPLETRLEHLEKAVLMLVDELKGSRQIQAQTQAQVTNLLHENRRLRIMLSPPEPVKTITWQPSEKKDPLEGLAWWEKTWIKMVHPERCRRSMN